MCRVICDVCRYVTGCVCAYDITCSPPIFCSFLLTILEQYAHHMSSSSQQPSHLPGTSSSLIVRLFGCYSIRMYGTVQYFTVMSNALYTSYHTKIHERYDLKGSWIGRVSDV